MERSCKWALFCNGGDYQSFDFLVTPKVTQWLVLVGYLVEQQSSDGPKYKATTELGTSIGMTAAWRDGAQGQYFAVSYDANAQHFILENLFKL